MTVEEFKLDKLIQMDLTIREARVIASGLRESEPPKPSKPREPKGAGREIPEQLRAYADELEGYKVKEDAWKAEKEAKKEKEKHLNPTLEAYAKHLAKLDEIPAKYQAKVWSLAWQYGHANGYEEVLMYVDELKDLFK